MLKTKFIKNLTTENAEIVESLLSYYTESVNWYILVVKFLRKNLSRN